MTYTIHLVRRRTATEEAEIIVIILGSEKKDSDADISGPVTISTKDKYRVESRSLWEALKREHSSSRFDKRTRLNIYLDYFPMPLWLFEKLQTDLTGRYLDKYDIRLLGKNSAPFSVADANPNKPVKDLVSGIFNFKLLDVEEERQVIGACGSLDPVLIIGVYGTGKSLLAEYIHYHSASFKNSFVAYSLPNTTPELFSTVLYGAVKGAYTSLMKDKDGLLKRADNGSLFLDEIGALRVGTAQEPIQTVLLDILEQSRRTGGISYAPVGAEGQPDKAGVSRARIIAATNQPNDLRPDLKSRFAHQIVLKSISQKPEKWDDYISHSLIMAMSVNEVHTARIILDPKARELVTHTPILSNPRELQILLFNLVRSERTHWSSEEVCIDEATIRRYLKDSDSEVSLKRQIPPQNLPVSYTDKSGTSWINNPDRLLADAHRHLDDIDDIDKEVEIKNMIWSLRRFELRLANEFGGSTQKKRMDAFGLNNTNTWKKYNEDPTLLHPTKMRKHNNKKSKKPLT